MLAAEPAEVVGDQVLRPSEQVGELADAPVAPGQLVEEPPPNRVSRQPQEVRPMQRGGGSELSHARKSYIERVDG
jgi:hypothetical protein